MRLVRAFGRFCWDFVIGDDWRIAAGVGVILTAGALLVAFGSLSDAAITLLSGGAIVAWAGCGIVVDARPSRSRRTDPSDD